MEGGRNKVVITGVSGFLGSWVLKTFVEDGSFDVRGTVRDPSNKKKMQPLKDVLGDKYSDVEFVTANLNDAESLNQAIEGCDYVVHTASPFPTKNPKSDDELIKPAVDGTIAVCEACHNHKVKRLVITSSSAAIYDHNNVKEHLTDKDWVDLGTKTPVYARSKALAEKAAWDYLDTIKSGHKFELCTINPTLIFGPILVKSPFATQKMCADVMTGKMKGLPLVYIGFVDVREVAKAHLLALTKGRNGTRYILAENTYSFEKLGEVLASEFKQYGYKVTTKKPPYCLVSMAALCGNKDAKDVKLQWNKKMIVDNSKSKSELGIVYRPIEETIIEMGYSQIEQEYVPDLRKNKEEKKQKINQVQASSNNVRKKKAGKSTSKVDEILEKAIEVDKPVYIHLEGNIYFLVLNSKNYKSSLNFFNCLNEALDVIDHDDNVQGKVLVTLSTDHDKFLKELDATTVKGRADLDGIITGFNRIVGRLLASRIPTIACINGEASLAGWNLGIAHNYRIMNKDRGSAWLLEIIVKCPLPKALNAMGIQKLGANAYWEACNMGEKWDAQKALEKGYAHFLYSENSIIDSTLELAHKLSSLNLDPVSMKNNNETIYEASLKHCFDTTPEDMIIDTIISNVSQS